MRPAREPVGICHVTPATNLKSILRDGLVLDPPQRNFDSSRHYVYLAFDEQEARLWAAEIARRAGGALECALLAVDLGEVPGLDPVVFERTGLRGARQARLPLPVPPQALRLVERFVAGPRRSRADHPVF